jgi:acyl-coenzyme A synthetase/AMP-(fatty) acid ligase
VVNISSTPSKESILKYLSSCLPNYMIPSDIMFVEKIPLNQNDKADKRMLEQIYLDNI